MAKVTQQMDIKDRFELLPNFLLCIVILHGPKTAWPFECRKPYSQITQRVPLGDTTNIVPNVHRLPLIHVMCKEQKASACGFYTILPK